MTLEDFYNNLASGYEKTIINNNSQLTHEVARVFKEQGIVSGSILDVGCGPGNLSGDIEGDFEFTGVDLSKKMLELAKARGYKTLEGKLEEVLSTMPDKSHDYVVAVGCLLFVEEVGAVLDDIHRIARKGWVVSLDDITKRYAESFGEKAGVPAFNHADVEVSDATVDYRFDSWESQGEQMQSRLVFKKV